MRPEPPGQDAPTPSRGRAESLATAAAKTVLRRELEAIKKQATAKHLQDVEGFRSWSSGFYARHAAFVAELLHLPLEQARAYVLPRRAELLAQGVEVLESWEQDLANPDSTSLAVLTALALVEESHA